RDAKDRRENGETAMAAVAHDRELGFAIMAPAEPVGGVGQPVLVERAGQRDASENREQRRNGTAAAEQLGEQEGERGHRADAGADQWERPTRGGYHALLAGRFLAGWQA